MFMAHGPMARWPLVNPIPSHVAKTCRTVHPDCSIYFNLKKHKVLSLLLEYFPRTLCHIYEGGKAVEELWSLYFGCLPSQSFGGPRFDALQVFLEL